MTPAGLLLSAAITVAGSRITADIGPGTRAVWERGRAPAVLVLPRGGEGWTTLAERVSGGRAAVDALRAANPDMEYPLRDVRVTVPWDLLDGRLRAAALQALFPWDHRTSAGWLHVVAAPWAGDGESWWEIAQWWCGHGDAYPELRRVNPGVPLYPARGARILIPEGLLIPELRAVAPTSGGSTGTGVAGPVPTPAPVPTAAPEAAPAPQLKTATRHVDGVLEYRDGVAVYRLRPGEALYSSVVVRFTGQLHAPDVNATAAELARLSGIKDVTDIPVGYPVKIPLDLLLPEYLPEGSPRRRAWEKEREELAEIRRVIRSANLDGIHVILDAGHGGADTGAMVAGVRESTYVYDVMERVKRVLQRETHATVWTLVRDLGAADGPPDRDVLPATRDQQLLVHPPYDLANSSTGVHLRWILTDSILQRLKKQGVSPERVAFVSIHADSLHPAVRGLMVYAPARGLRPSRGPRPAGLASCREARELSRPRFSARFRSRSEALSLQLGSAVVDKARQFDVGVHAFEPVRSSVLRGRSRWVPAVLRYSEVPTSVLIEICNLNNKEDRSLLLTWRYRERLAHAIAAGLAEAFSH